MNAALAALICNLKRVKSAIELVESRKGFAIVFVYLKTV
jgi:hypothetical protein